MSPDVLRELWHVRSLLPLFSANTKAIWHHHVQASDASPYGLGVTSRMLDSDTIGAHGRCAEKWRYRFEKTIRA
eukprot:6804686-Karenia_brevis.AAC.1